jgi:hypothetical protein
VDNGGISLSSIKAVTRVCAKDYDSRVLRRSLLTVLCLLTGSAATAADLPAGVTLTPTQPLYYVVRDAFVHDAPDNTATRVGQVVKGQRITVVGKTVVPKTKDAQWLALKRANGKIGFVFGAALVPMIDGTLKAPLQGKLSAADRPDCRYIVAPTMCSRLRTTTSPSNARRRTARR